MKNRMEEETEKLLLEHYDEFYRLAYCYVKNRDGRFGYCSGSCLQGI